MNLHDIKDRSPNLRLIEMLEYQLERAKTGELRSAVMVTSRDDNSTGHAWAMDDRTWQQPMLGEMVYVQNEFMLKMSLIRDCGVLRTDL